MITKLAIGARVDGGLDAVDHLRRGDELLARPVAAALGAAPGPRCACAPAPNLISDFTVRAMLNADRAEAGVGVDQQRQVARRR